MFHFKYKTAMKRLLFTFLALCLAVAGSAQSGQMTSKLPTIDITKEYPKKKILQLLNTFRWKHRIKCCWTEWLLCIVHLLNTI